jgi:hypothetical protein
MAHTPEKRIYLTEWARAHRAKLHAMPLAKLKALPSTVYSRAVLKTRLRRLSQKTTAQDLRERSAKK